MERGCLGESGRYLGESGRCLGESGRYLSESGRCLDESGKCLGNSDKCLGENGRCMGEGGRCLGECGRRGRCLDERGIYLGESDWCLGESGRCLGDNRCRSECGGCMGENGRCLDDSGRCLGQNGRCMGVSGRCLVENGRCLGKSDRCLGESGRCRCEYGTCLGESGSCLGEGGRCPGESGRFPGEYGMCLGDRGRCLDENDRSLGESGRCLGMSDRCLGECGRCLGESVRCVGESGSNLDESGRCMDENGRCLVESGLSGMRGAPPTVGVAGSGGRGGVSGDGSERVEGTAPDAVHHEMPSAEVMQTCSHCQAPLDPTTVWDGAEPACESCEAAWEWSGADVVAPGAREASLTAFRVNVSAHLPPGTGLTITKGSSEFGGTATTPLRVDHQDCQGQLGFLCLSSRRLPAGHHPLVSDMALAAVLGQLAPLWGWNTEKQRRVDSRTVILSPQTWTSLYIAARTESDQPEGAALRQQAKKTWNNLAQNYPGPGLAGGPTFAGVVRLAGDADHFVAVKMVLHTGVIDVSDCAKARLAGICALCGDTCRSPCEGSAKALVFENILRALIVAAPGNMPMPSKTRCRWDLHRRQSNALDSNCGLFALTDLNELLSGSALRCDAVTADKCRGWSQLLLWASSDLVLTVRGSGGRTRCIHPWKNRHLPDHVAAHWAAAISSRHQVLLKSLRSMNVITLSRGLSVEERDRASISVEVGHGEHQEHLRVHNLQVTRQGTRQVGLFSLAPSTYVSTEVLDAASASAAKAFGWRTLHGSNKGLCTAPILLNWEWWRSASTATDVRKVIVAKKLALSFTEDKAPTFIGCIYIGLHYFAVRITLANASIVVIDSMRAVISAPRQSALEGICRALQVAFPEACQNAPTCLSGDQSVPQKEFNVDCALFTFANLTALAADSPRTCSATDAADLRELLPRVLWARGNWEISDQSKRLHPADLTGADVTLLREWGAKYLAPLSLPETARSFAPTVDSTRNPLPIAAPPFVPSLGRPPGLVQSDPPFGRAPRASSPRAAPPPFRRRSPPVSSKVQKDLIKPREVPPTEGLRAAMDNPAEKIGCSGRRAEEDGITWEGSTAALHRDHLRRYIEGTSTVDERRHLFNALWELSAPALSFCGPDPVMAGATPPTPESVLSLPSSFWSRLQGSGGVHSVLKWMKALGNLKPRKFSLPYFGLLSVGIISWNVAKGQVAIYPFVSNGRRAWTSGEEARFRDAVGFMMATSLGVATSLRRVDVKWPRPRGPSRLSGPALRRQLASLLDPQGGQPEADLRSYVEGVARAAQEESAGRWTESLWRACALPSVDPQVAPLRLPPALPYSTRFNQASIVSCNLGPRGWRGNEATIRALVRSRPALILLQDVRLQGAFLGSKKFRQQLARVAPGYKAFYTARSLPADDSGRAPYPRACVTLYHECLDQSEMLSEKGGEDSAARGRAIGTVHKNPRHKTSLLVVNVYLPVAGHESQFDECWTYIRGLIQRALQLHPDLHLVLVGDFNTAFSTPRVGYSTKWGAVRSRDARAMALPRELNLLEVPLQPAELQDVDQPAVTWEGWTKEGNLQAAQLDHFLIRSKWHDSAVACVGDRPQGSHIDHRPIWLCLSNRILSPPPTTSRFSRQVFALEGEWSDYTGVHRS